MLDIKDINEWQIVDPELNLVYPWYTDLFLDWLKTQTLSATKVLEFGGGYSSLWWNKKAYLVDTVEDNEIWRKEIKDTDNSIRIFSPSTFVEKVCQDYYDIVIIDNDWADRDEIISVALLNVKKGGIIICDNWMQPDVWICKIPEVLTKYEHKIFGHSKHKNWQTAYFIIK